MPHMPKPFFRTARSAWYVQLGKQQLKLCDGPKTALTEKAAWSAFHQLMVERAANDNTPQASTSSASPPALNGLLVSELFDKYLEWCQKHREKRTYDGYVWHLQRFCDHLKDRTTMPALALRPFHVVEWLDAHPGWGPTYRRNATGAVQRAYNWAEELGHIEINPVRKIKKPAARRREEFVTPEDWVRIRDSYPAGDPFRAFLEFCWHTGCRPQEARIIEPRHVHLDKALITIPPKEAKGRKKWRVIRLEGRALELARERLAGARGTLFVNRDGAAWTSYAVNCRFGRLKEKLGERFCAYEFRHGFTQRLLISGVDHLTVAALLGHADGQMVQKVYSHMDQADAHLRDALKKAEGA
ncbi:Tyrosine recombinase XerC [Gemmata sp. SH-PL17]|uniref:tyrosine-type recombinase/integrase n=1 Tax=Gemmata sp. SH-PL17 TaxID=1630693 RepID=UPI00078CA283|nr:tyrosine-type recombinase/integrase [Gemmata sp. SH-PL17]AMV24245.1 Tyrosine recombinase XerC [Gemmata sp. SH-PL17]